MTILQPGWRLGGKCARAATGEFGNRIEEHGLHIWFGSYDNAITLMTRCYESWVGIPSAMPSPRSTNAFEGVDEAILWSDTTTLAFKEVRFRRTRRGPGTSNRSLSGARLGRADSPS